MTAARKSPKSATDFDALAALAEREYRAGRLSQAAAALRQITAIRPDVAEAHNNLGNILAMDGKLPDAAAALQRAIELRPDFAAAHHNMANVLTLAGQLDAALARFEHALRLRPDYAETHNNLGYVHWKLGQFAQAAACYERALALQPNFALAHFRFGVLRRDQGRLDEAAAHYLEALAVRPDYAEAIHNLGTVLALQGKLDEAQARFQQALALAPNYPDVHNNLGKIDLIHGKFNEAQARFERAVALRPEYPDAEFSLATCYLIQEDYQRGWPRYEARLRLPGAKPAPHLPRWSGQPLAGRRLLLVAEQGLGDTLQFLRFARSFKAQGAQVVLAAQPALGPLLSSHPNLDELFLIQPGEPWPVADFYLSLHSVPGALAIDAATIPRKVPYLSADAALVEKWRRELAAIDGFKIGIAWQGAPGYEADRWRSIPLAKFAPLARLPGVRLVSLQKGFGAEQIAAVDFPVLDLSDRLDEATGALVDTAAVIANLDLLITSDTAIVHLAGALGAPIWVALHLSPNWRWLLDREDSPWYPSMRLFRQKTLGDWPEVFQRIAEAVEQVRWHMASARQAHEDKT